MSHDLWLIRVEHMLEAVAKIEAVVADMDYDAFTQSSVAQDVVFWNFHILGEAVRHIPEHITEKHPDVPWRMIRSLRNVIVHHYEGIQLNLIWETIHQLPDLKRDLESLAE